MPDHEGALLLKATCDFTLRHDTRSANTSIGKCKRSRYGNWRYSRAFLLAYDGKLADACEMYERAFKSRLSDEAVPVQVEEFMQLILDREPGAVPLHFFSGLVNLKAKGDWEGARRDFSTFLEKHGAAFQAVIVLTRARPTGRRLPVTHTDAS